MRRFINTDNILYKIKGLNIDILPLGFRLFLLFIWEMVSRLGWVQPFILPSPLVILKALIYNLPVMWQHIEATLYSAGVGFIMAILLAIIIGIFMDRLPIVKRTLYPLIITSQTVPIVTLAPLFAMWFGFGYLPKIVIVVLVCFFPITISLLEGLASVDKDLLNLLKSMGAKSLDVYNIVKLPAALPNFFAGLKISGTYSIMGAVIGEWVGGKKGLGVYMMRARQSFAIGRVFASIVVIVLLSIIVLKIITFIEGLVMPWNKELNKLSREE